MCVEADNVPVRDAALAAFIIWFTFAGFVIFPTTYQTGPGLLANSKGGELIRSAAGNLPLLTLPIIICALGVAAECVLWYKWRTRYVVLLGEIF